MGMHIGELIGGTMIINIFAWPGVAYRYAVSASAIAIAVIQCFTDDGDGVRAG